MTSEPLEAEQLESEAYPEAELAEDPYQHPPQKEGEVDSLVTIVGLSLLFLMMLMGAFAGGLFEDDDNGPGGPGSNPGQGTMVWKDPVWLPRDPDCVDDNGQEYPEYAIGYEPSIAVDSEGNIYYTAHKDLRWAGPNGGPGGGEGGMPGPGPYACKQQVLPPYSNNDRDTTWDYYASWFLVSQDNGETWGPPNDWGPNEPTAGQPAGSMILPGDEGDIGIDAQGRVFFVDTYLEDNWLHVWDDGGNNYITGHRLQSSAADDRPWITAQGDGIVHYLGNSGVAVQGVPLSPGTNGNGRYWYYRGELNGNLVTFDQGRGVPGGWAHIAAERNGDYVYIIQEANNGGSGGVKVWVSKDTGIGWNDPVIIGPLEGTHPEGYPWIAPGENGVVYATWQNSPSGGRAPGTLYIARSDDYGRNWEHWDISSGHPYEEGGVYLYPNIDVGPGNTVALTYYGNKGEHTAGDEWHLYADVLVDPQPGENFSFQAIDPFPLHTSSQEEADIDDLHPLHDFFEVAISPKDGSVNIAYQYNIGDHPFEAGEEQRYLMYIRGEWTEDPFLAAGPAGVGGSGEPSFKAYWADGFGLLMLLVVAIAATEQRVVGRAEQY